MISTQTRLNPLRIAGPLLALLFAFSATPAYAQRTGEDIERITISPVKNRMQVKAGQKITSSVTVINAGSKAYKFRAFASPYYVEDQTYESKYDTSAGQPDASKWVQFDKTEFTLKPGERTEVPYTVLTPKTAAPGGHYAVVFAETLGSPTPGQNEVARRQRVGSILLLNVDGKTNRSGELVSDSTPFLQFNPPLNASLRIRNTGNVDFDVALNVKVRDIFGREKHMTDTSFLVLPETTRKTLVPWNQAPFLGVFKVTQTAKFLGKTETSSKYVVMVPVWEFIALIGIVTVGIGSFIVKRRLANKKSSTRN